MKFSLRELLLMTVIVALVVGWWVDHSRLASRAERATVLEAVLDLEGMEVTYQKQGNSVSQINVTAKPMPNSSAPDPKLPKE